MEERMLQRVSLALVFPSVLIISNSLHYVWIIFRWRIFLSRKNEFFRVALDEHRQLIARSNIFDTIRRTVHELRSQELGLRHIIH